MRQLVQLQKDLEQINDANIQVVGVSYDSGEVLKKFAGRQKVTYPLLSDTESKVITAYGVLNKNAGGRQKGIPIPTTFVIDQEGVVRAKLPGTTRVRHTTEQLLEAAKGLN